jgi:hypothetical protein
MAKTKQQPPVTGSAPTHNGEPKAAAPKPKGACPVSREQFRAGAKPVMVKIGDVPLAAMVKEFGTGSLGWFLNGKTVIEVGGVACEVQIGLNLTIVHSKELPQ